MVSKAPLSNELYFSPIFDARESYMYVDRGVDHQSDVRRHRIGRPGQLEEPSARADVTTRRQRDTLARKIIRVGRGRATS